MIDTVITNVALPDIRGNLGATLSEAGWVSTSYACANVVIIPLSAWLGMRFGKKNYFLFSLVGFTAASLLCGFSQSLGMLIFARVVQGITGGGLLAKAQSLVFEAFPREERPMAQALFGLGVIAGPGRRARPRRMADRQPRLALDILHQRAARAPRRVDVPRPFPEGREGLDPRADLRRLVRDRVPDAWASRPSRSCWRRASRTTGSRRASSCGPRSARVVGLGLFIHRELTTEHPAVDLRILRFPSMVGGSIYSAILGMGIYGIMFAVPIFVQDFLHYTALQSGLVLVPGALASAVAMVAYGKIANRLPQQLLIGLGATLTACTGFLLMGINPGTGTPQLFWPLVVRGLGSVMMFMPLSIATLGPLPKKDIPAGAGFYSLTRQLGSSIGIALITTMLARRISLHRAILVAKVTDFSQPTIQRMGMLGGSLGQHGANAAAGRQGALAVIDRIINGQAALLAYSDIFLYVAILFLASLPLILLLGDKHKKPEPPVTPADDEAIEEAEAEAAVH